MSDEARAGPVAFTGGVLYPTAPSVQGSSQVLGAIASSGVVGKLQIQKAGPSPARFLRPFLSPIKHNHSNLGFPWMTARSETIHLAC
jgi:hypothetical protein